MSGGYFDVDRVPYDGRPLTPPRESRRRRQRSGKHGAECSSNPEIGCVCGYVDYVSDHDGSDAGW
jgi:hypothetical protein